MKKRFFCIITIFIIAIIITTFLIGCGLVKDINGFAFGTFYSISLDKGTIKKENIINMLDNIENLLSLSVDNSDINKINSAEVNQWVEVNPTTIDAINKSIELYNLTDGYFNPFYEEIISLWGFYPPFSSLDTHSLPDIDYIQNEILPYCNPNYIIIQGNKVKKLNIHTRIDLGGIGKGYAVSCINSILLQADASGLVNIGGNLASVNSDYKIGLTPPRDSDYSYILSFTLPNGYTCATSGDYEKYFEINNIRYCHIIDKTGISVNNDIMSVSVISKDGATADALSTAIFSMGKKDGFAFAQQNGYKVIIITKDKKILINNIEITIKDTGYICE